MWPSCIGFKYLIGQYFIQFLKLDINVETTYDPYHNKCLIFLHQTLHYNQTYNFAFNHDHKF
jgi:hypothetical protein